MRTDFDLVIRGGQVADGLGSPLFEADVALIGDRICSVGSVRGRGLEEIDAAGAVVAPGFVDIHTHYDGQAVWDSQLTSSSWHGVTTVVMGNCGVGFAPVRSEDRDRLIELMEGVEDIPGVALHEGLDWKWESFSEYLQAVDRRSHDIDICAQLPHGPLRVYVMGERAAKLEPATESDIARMRELTREALRAGALGFSSSRSINHRSIKGDPTPSLRAAENELMGIAMALRDEGRGVLQLLSDFDTPSMEEEFAMLCRVARASGRPMSFGLVQDHDRPDAWRKLLGLIEGGVAEGLQLRGQITPRPIGMLLGLQASTNPFTRTEAYTEIAEKPLPDRVATMRDPAFRARVIQEATARHSRLEMRLLFSLGDPPQYAPGIDCSVAAMAERSNVNPYEVAYDLLLQNEGHNFLYAPAKNYKEATLDVCREMLASPYTLIALGDGGAHVASICDSSLPTFVMTTWSKELGRKDGFDLSWLIKRQTSDTARAVGLMDRGVVSPGALADLNVIALDELSLLQPEMKFDLPAGGKRLQQKARGYRTTIKSGRVTYRDGQSTGVLPGRLVRGPQSARA